jgi:hypothetical protein
MNNCAVINKQETEIKIEITARIESIIEEFIKEIGLKPTLRELIRAFLRISEGRNYFEASRKQLAASVHGQHILRDKNETKRKTDSIKHHLGNLLKWQEKNGLEIIRIVTFGNRVHMTDGTFNYNATRYHFILLDEVLKMIPADSAESFEVSFEKVVEVLKEKYQPVERHKPYHPNHKIQKAGKALLTTLDNIFKWNIEAKSNPVESCERFLRQLNERFKELSSDWKEQQSRETAIADFERLMTGCEEIAELSSNFNKESELPLES